MKGQIDILYLLCDAQKRAQHHFWDISVKAWPEFDHKEALSGPRGKFILQNEKPVIFKIKKDINYGERLRD